ncbi:MAG: alanine racemase [Candidatus Zixiibacteriota bacterium]|nr:MAG: alanine racemase [candidate division Zixibacteria bacterium]
MTRSSLGFILRAAELLNKKTARLDDQDLKRFVQSFLDRRESFLGLIRGHGSPLYAVDTAALTLRVKQFREAFLAAIPEAKFFFALKSNSHPLIATTLVRKGFGLDVSSGRELEAAIDHGAQDIVFSGPGKLPEELEIAIRHSSHVTVLIDSFGELKRLEEVASRMDTAVRAGVRITTDESGIWRKFGIPLDSLGKFFESADGCRHVNVCGVQFHLSWNMNSEPHVIFLARLGSELGRLGNKFRRRIRFIDIGGGYWPEAGEWLQPAATPEGVLRTAMSEELMSPHEHYWRPSAPITDFAQHIGQALRKHLPDDMKCAIYAEPGRWLCHDAMHILLTVVDRKAPDVVITDGGTNAVGWERFETDYFPVINLSRPGLKEHGCLVAGSLCTPHDIWGYSYFGDDIRPGDILLVPNQGAYTYSLRQHFIKPLPKSVELPRNHAHQAPALAPKNHSTT